MNISEAIKARTIEKQYITRELWQAELWPASDLKVLPTNTPDCCVLISQASRGPCRGWQPQAEDLCADDWIVVD